MKTKNIPTKKQLAPTRRRAAAASPWWNCLLVLTILAILAGIVLPKLGGAGRRRRITARQDRHCSLQDGPVHV